MSVEVVTVQVQFSVPELRLHTCYLIYTLSHCVDSETFNGRNQSAGCVLAYVTRARDSESKIIDFLPSYRWRDSVTIFF